MRSDSVKYIVMAVVAIVLAFGVATSVRERRARERAMAADAAQQDAYILVKDGAVVPLWGYQQLKMRECAWCRRTVNLNRHHVVPQSANPALRDVRENLVVLCRDCHFVLGHRCNWKQYNPDVLYICTHFTNCIRSADTRYAVTNEEWKAGSGHTNCADLVTRENPVSYFNDGADITNVLGNVTNDLLKSVREALERIRSSDE